MNKRVNLDSPELADSLRRNEPRNSGIVKRRQPRRSFMIDKDQQAVRQSSLDVALEEIDPVPEDLAEEPEEPEFQPKAEPVEEPAPEPTVAHLAEDAEEGIAEPNFKYGIVPNTNQGWAMTAIAFGFVGILFVTLASFRKAGNQTPPVLSATDLNEKLNISRDLKRPVDSQSVTDLNAKEFEVAPTLSTYSSYTVQKDSPRLLQIDKLNVAALVESAQTNASGNLVLPTNTYNVAWYNKSRKPTANNGVILLVGHASGYASDGIFSKLDELATGDKLVLERGDGQKMNFVVLEKLFHEYGEEDMLNAQLPQSFDTLNLNLLSCDCRSKLPNSEKQRSVLIRSELIEQ